MSWKNTHVCFIVMRVCSALYMCACALSCGARLVLIWRAWLMFFSWNFAWLHVNLRLSWKTRQTYVCVCVCVWMGVQEGLCVWKWGRNTDTQGCKAEGNKVRERATKYQRCIYIKRRRNSGLLNLYSDFSICGFLTKSQPNQKKIISMIIWPYGSWEKKSPMAFVERL